MDKAQGAFLTIGELASELGVAQHILRYWESRFPQLRPLQRSGNRRYYRPADVEIARQINQLLNEQGFTVRGAQRVLDGKADDAAGAARPAVAAVAAAPAVVASANQTKPVQPDFGLDGSALSEAARGQFDSSDIALLIARLTVIRESLKEAIDAT
jgi:DNA-binding transcriptional MerR regulator